MNQYFPKTYELFAGDINVKVDYLIMQKNRFKKYIT